MKQLATWDKIKDDTKTLITMATLRDRWADEREYENWSDYEDVMKKLFPDVIKGTKKPFGVILRCDDGNLHVFLKIRGNQICFAANSKN